MCLFATTTIFCNWLNVRRLTYYLFALRRILLILLLLNATEDLMLHDGCLVCSYNRREFLLLQLQLEEGRFFIFLALGGLLLLWFARATIDRTHFLLEGLIWEGAARITGRIFSALLDSTIENFGENSDFIVAIFIIPIALLLLLILQRIICI